MYYECCQTIEWYMIYKCINYTGDIHDAFKILNGIFLSGFISSVFNLLIT